MEFIYRDADISDIKDIALLEKSVFSDSWSETVLATSLCNPLYKLLCAFLDSKLVGYACVMCVCEEISVNRIAVAENARRMGIATELLKQCFDYFPDVERAFLEVRESNISAVKLYEKLDFKVISVRKNYYSKPTENALIMEKFFGQ